MVMKWRKIEDLPSAADRSSPTPATITIMSTDGKKSTVSGTVVDNDDGSLTYTFCDSKGGNTSLVVQKYGASIDERGRIIRKTDCEEFFFRAMRAQQTGDDQEALRWLAEASVVYNIARHNEERGHRDDRRAGSSGRRPISVDEKMLAYAKSLPKRSGGRSHKSRWLRAAEKYNPGANEAALNKIARRLRRHSTRPKT
jgi:hypothetical protein